MIKYHDNIIQGTDEWFELRRGLLTASEMKLIMTPTLKPSKSDKMRCHLFELLAQRVSGFVEPSYVSDDMLRGKDDELDAKILYNAHYEPVHEVGFVTNDEWGFTLGYSPDGLIGNDGLIEVKSRRQKYQAETLINNEMPLDYALQIQTGLLITKRKWCDFISYCGGLYMLTLRVWPDQMMQEAIITAARAFEEQMAEQMVIFSARVSSPDARILKTERRKEEEITI